MSDGLNSAGEPLNLPEPQVGANPFKVEAGSVSEVMSELSGAKSSELGSTVFQPPAHRADPAALAIPVDVTAKLTKINTPMTPVGSTASLSATPSIADDEDLIEKEWVEKAKQIVERTKDDPHVQNQEIGRYKAEYMKKRFNKDIKTSAES